MRPDPYPRARRWRLQVLAALYALLGGAIAATLLFNGLSTGGIALGLAVTLLLIVATGLRCRSAGATAVVAAYSLAFVLVTWPLIFLAGTAIAPAGCDNAPA